MTYERARAESCHEGKVDEHKANYTARPGSGPPLAAEGGEGGDRSHHWRGLEVWLPSPMEGGGDPR